MAAKPRLSDYTMRCDRHTAVATTLRCDQCGRPYCRDCLVSRYITSRSMIWLCRSCAAGWSNGGGWGRRSYGDLVSRRIPRFWWLIGAVAALALLSGSHPLRLFGV